MRKILRKFQSLIRLSAFDTTTQQGRSSERYRRVALTTGSMFLSKGIGIAANLISVPLTLHYLGVERYGLWMTISSSIAILSFADLGMGSGLLNSISEANGKDDRKSAQTYVSSAFFILSGIAFILLAVFAVIYRFISWEQVFNIGSESAAQEISPTIAVLIIVFALNIPLGVAQRVRMGYQEDFNNQLWAILGSILGLIGILLAIHFQAGLPWLVLAVSGGPLVALFINGIALFTQSRPWLLPKIKYFDWPASIKVAKTGFWFLIFQIFAIIGVSSDNLIIAHALGPSAVATYSVTQRLFTTAVVSQYFLLPLWPAFGEAMARADYAWAMKTFNRAIAISLGIGVFTGGLLLIFSKHIISIWAGSNVVPSTQLVWGFTAWLLLVCISNATTTFINSGPLLVRQLPFTAISAIISIGLKIIFVSNFQTAGVIWGGVIGYAFFYTFPAWKLARKTLMQDA